jgi:PTS system mannose-specific IIA component
MTRTGQIGIVIVAHGSLAREYLAVVEHVMGPQQGMRAITFEGDHDRASKADEIRAAADAVDQGQGVVVVCDLIGASPANLSALACEKRHRHILYGANLPMLIKLAQSRDLDLAAAVEAAGNAGRKYINSRDLTGWERP